MVENAVQIKSEIMINPDASAKNQENIMCKKRYVWNRGIYTYENSIYLESIIGDSVIKCGEITQTTKTIPKKAFFN